MSINYVKQNCEFIVSRSIFTRYLLIFVSDKFIPYSQGRITSTHICISFEEGAEFTSVP